MSLSQEIATTERTPCCIVGGGPAGMVLALLLARQRIPVTLLETHGDFDREFRGDTLHASVMENLDQIGLADEVLEICHARLEEARFITEEGESTVAAFRRLRSSFPYVAMIPQAEFLGFLAREASRFETFRLRMKANARQLIEQDCAVRGVIYRAEGEMHELRADLVIGADGRGSRVRRTAGLELTATAPPMDVLWFRLPRRPEDAEISNVALRFGRGVGINYAIQDAVATANILTEPLRDGRVEASHLAAVEQRRRWPTAVIQGIQAFLQRRVVAGALRSDSPFRLPAPVRLLARFGALQRIPAWMIAYGVRPEVVRFREPAG